MDKDFFIKVVDDERNDTLLKFSLVDFVKCINYEGNKDYRNVRFDENGRPYPPRYELMFVCIGIDRVFYKECESEIEMQMLFAKFKKLLGNEELNDLL